jgi:PncC family amidohydrolase
VLNAPSADASVKREKTIGRMLRDRGWSLAVAESCTGGLLGHRITSASGSSAYFVGGVIAYANSVKVRELGVPADLLATEGAVSAPVAQRMAAGVRERLGSDVGVGITGIAGPQGGTREKPVGLVFVAVSGPSGGVVRRFLFEGDRLAVKTAGSEAALEMLAQYLQPQQGGG